MLSCPWPRGYECGTRAVFWRPGEVVQVWCGGCGVLFALPSGRGRRRKFCLACTPRNATHLEYQRGWRAANPAAREGYNAARRVDHPDKPCKTCGQSFKPNRIDRLYCRPYCKPKNNWATTTRHLQSRDRIKILNRDGWVCYLCQRPIRRDLPYPHPLSRSVDHVIPVSAGGSDRPDNLRAAHWGCNREKGDQLPGTEVWVPREALA